MSKLIAFSGTHGTGKTTSAGHLFLDLKYKYPNKSIHPFVDHEASCPFPINTKATPETQLWLFHDKISRELSLLNLFDIVVTDRTVVDVIAYSACLGYDALAASMFEDAKVYLSKYHQITFKKIDNNQFCYSDGIRETDDKLFRMQIEDYLSEYYEELIEGGYIPGAFKYA
jgi:hypothetical protein